MKPIDLARELSPASLRYFQVICDEGSLTAAARALRVSQPSLTAAVQRLEEQLATTLLVREARGVKPTATGQVLLTHARQALRAVDDLRDEIHALETEPRGRFVIGCHESLAAYALPPFMASTLSEHPGIDLALWNGNSADVQAAVVDRRIDLGLVVNPVSHPDCVVQPLFKDRVEFVIAASLLKTQGRRIVPSELLARLPVIYVPELKQVQYLLGALAQKGTGPARPLVCSSLELVKSFVLDDVGIGILPRRVARFRVPDGRIVPVSANLPVYDDMITLVRRFDMHMTRAARLVVDGLRGLSAESD